MNKSASISIGTTLFVLAIAACDVRGASPEWLQWGGPQRNFHATESKIATDWPESGPKKLWSIELGDGYSAIVSDGERIYTQARSDDKERVVALDAKTGKTVWEHAYDAPKFEKLDIRFGEGPRSTPLIIGDRLYAVGCFGRFMCLNKSDGKVIWERDMIKDAGGTEIMFGYAASPIQYKDTIIVLCGEAEGRVVALDADNGEVKWKSEPYLLSYASPILIDVDGHKQLAILMGDQAASLDPDNGKLLWSYPTPNQWNTSMNTPIYGPGNQLFVSSGGDDGSVMLKLGYDGDTATVEKVWECPKFRASMGTVVRVGDNFYGTTGQDPAFVACVDAKTGELLWRERGFAGGGFVAAGDQLIFLDYKGVLAVTSASPEKFTVHCKAELMGDPSWTSPTLIGSHLFVRDRKSLVALDLS